MGQEDVRTTLSKDLRVLLKKKAESLGIKEPEYVRSLIIEDLKKNRI